MADSDWVVAEIADGIQKLLTLGLEGQPASELMRGTVMAWAEAITFNRELDREVDAQRFRAAFVILMRDSRRWPTPRQFLDALPPRPQRAALPPRAPSEAEAKAALARIDELLDTLR
jgi:hypothetical protein